MRLSEGQKRSWTEATEHYHQTVAGASSYLYERGLNGPRTLASYRLGYVASPLPGDEGYVGRLVIPYLTPTGVVSLKFRDLCLDAQACKDAGHAKYLFPEGAKDRVFNVQALHDAAETIYVSEGELDAISATVAGFPTIGISGNTKWEPHYEKLLEDFDDVVVLCDGDEAGRNFGKLYSSRLNNVRLVHFPPGEDANSFLVKRSVPEFRDLVGG